MELKKVDWFAMRVITIGSLLIILASLYHTSFNGFLNISEKLWDCAWAISQDGLLLFSFILVVILSYGVIKKFFKYVLIPICVVRLIYHLSSYFGLFLIDPEKWENLWSYLCVIVFVVGFVYCIIVLKDKSYG
jgi:glucan phosphoethanolaminetransferase (alkaline phosphatase superfamily)